MAHYTASFHRALRTGFLQLLLMGIAALPALAFTVDTDLDSLPDDWETAHARNPAVPDYVVVASPVFQSNSSGSTCIVGQASHTCTIGNSGVVCKDQSNPDLAVPNYYHELDVPASLANGQIKATGLAVGRTGTGAWSCACHAGGSTCWGTGAPASATCSVSQQSANAIINTKSFNLCAGYPFTRTMDCQVTGARTIACSITGKDRYNNTVTASGNVTAEADIGHIAVGGIESSNDTHGLYAMTLRGLQQWVVTYSGSNLTFTNKGIQSVPDMGDLDGDGLVPLYDGFPLDPAQAGDVDGDGVNGFVDNCPGNANVNQLNTDGDTQGDVCDNDDDNDGVADISDKFPLNVAASSDADVDGFPGSWNAACDATCQSNSGLVLDNCPTTTNANQLNTDGDTQGNACDTDDDNDGVLDTSDAFPLNAAESLDTDLDGTGNNADPDDDNDGLPDVMDPLPLQAKFNRDGTYQGSQVRDSNGVQ